MRYKVVSFYKGVNGFTIVDADGNVVSCHITQQEAEDKVILLLDNERYIEEEVTLIMQRAGKKIQKKIDKFKSQEEL